MYMEEEECINVVCGQTNYDKEEASRLLKESNMNYMKVIKEYLNKDKVGKEEKVENLTINEHIHGEIRKFLNGREIK